MGGYHAALKLSCIEMQIDIHDRCNSAPHLCFGHLLCISQNASSIATGGQGEGRVPLLTAKKKKSQKLGKRGENLEKEGKNQEEKAKIGKVLSLCPSWQIGLAMLLQNAPESRPVSKPIDSVARILCYWVKSPGWRSPIQVDNGISAKGQFLRYGTKLQWHMPIL